MWKSIFAAAASALPAAAFAQAFTLQPLTERDQQRFEGYVCMVVEQGSTLFISDTQAGAVRLGGRLVRLIRSNPSLRFNPDNDRSLAMRSAGRGETVSVSFGPRRGRSVEGYETYSRPVRMIVTRRAAGRSRSSASNVTLTCAS